MASEIIGHALERERPRIDGRRQVTPPVRIDHALMKTDSPKLTRIAEDECAPAQEQHEMIVWAGDKTWPLDSQLAGHAQMHAQPPLARKSEQHLFAVGHRA